MTFIIFGIYKKLTTLLENSINTDRKVLSINSRSPQVIETKRSRSFT